MSLRVPLANTCVTLLAATLVLVGSALPSRGSTFAILLAGDGTESLDETVRQFIGLPARDVFRKSIEVMEEALRVGWGVEDVLSIRSWDEWADWDSANFSAAIADFTEDIGPGDVLILYYAGHGTDGILEAFSITPSDLDTLLGHKADKTVIILDACGSCSFSEVVTSDDRLLIASVSSDGVGPLHGFLTGILDLAGEAALPFTTALSESIRSGERSVLDTYVTARFSWTALANQSLAGKPCYWYYETEDFVIPNDPTPVFVYHGNPDEVEAVAFSPNGRLVASSSSASFEPSGPPMVRLWSRFTGQDACVLLGHTKDITSIAFSPDGRRLASGSYDGTIKVWDVGSGSLVRIVQGDPEPVDSVAFSPDGDLLASGGLDGRVRLWNVGTWDEVRTLAGHVGWIGSVQFSPDGTRFASAEGGHDTVAIKVWDTATWRELYTLRGYSDSFDEIAFSPDSRLLAGACRDNTVRLWNVATGQEWRVLRAHTGSVYSIAFSPDGRTLASGAWDDTVRLWDVASGQLLRTLRRHTSGVTSVAFSSDGVILASGSYDETVCLWNVSDLMRR